MDKNNGILEKPDLEQDFDRRVSVVFPTKSPVNALSGHSDVQQPEPMPTGVFGKISNAIKKKLLPLVSAKQNMDDVYSKGYFERHYPGADEHMKGLLHQDAISSWAHAQDNGPDTGEPEGDEKPTQILLTININK